MIGVGFAALAAARWIHFIAVMLVFGASLFPFYALPAQAHALAGLAHIRGPVRVAALIALVSGVCWAAASLASITGDPASLFDADTLWTFFFDTGFGKIWALRFLLLVTMLLAVLTAGRKLPTRNIASALSAALAALLLVSQAWIGHPAATAAGERTIVVAGYALHVLGASAWLGGLVPLLLLLRAHSAEKNALEFALRRFSALGMLAIAMILAGGLSNAWARWDSIDGFIASAWGKVLIVKVLGFFGLFILAAVNRFVLMPRLDANGSARMRLVRNVLAEQAGGVLILFAASILGLLPPPA